MHLVRPKTINEVMRDILSQSIELRFDTLRWPYLAIYVRDLKTGLSAILCEERLWGREKLLKAVLAEELAHHCTVGISRWRKGSYRSVLGIWADEYRAAVWAAEYLCPLKDVRRLLGKTYTPWEIAEAFDVDIQVVRTQLNRLEVDKQFVSAG